MIEIYEGGTEATPKLNPVKSMITAAIIRFKDIRYELTYFHEGKQETVWMNEKEFTVPDGTEKKKIGYK